MTTGTTDATNGPSIKHMKNETLGQYLEATQDIPSGTVIIKEVAPLSSTMLLSTIQYRKDLHVNLPVDGYIWRTQHMSVPNAYLLVKGENDKAMYTECEGDLASVSLVTLKDIKKGEQVGYDYNSTELILSRSFEMTGDDGKSVTVGGFLKLSQTERFDLVQKVGTKTVSPAVLGEWLRPTNIPSE